MDVTSAEPNNGAWPLLRVPPAVVATPSQLSHGPPPPSVYYYPQPVSAACGSLVGWPTVSTVAPADASAWPNSPFGFLSTDRAGSGDRCGGLPLHPSLPSWPSYMWPQLAGMAYPERYGYGVAVASGGVYSQPPPATTDFVGDASVACNQSAQPPPAGRDLATASRPRASSDVIAIPKVWVGAPTAVDGDTGGRAGGCAKPAQVSVAASGANAGATNSCARRVVGASPRAVTPVSSTPRPASSPSTRQRGSDGSGSGVVPSPSAATLRHATATHVSPSGPPSGSTACVVVPSRTVASVPVPLPQPCLDDASFGVPTSRGASAARCGDDSGFGVPRASMPAPPTPSSRAVIPHVAVPVEGKPPSRTLPSGEKVFSCRYCDFTAKTRASVVTHERR